SRFSNAAASRHIGQRLLRRRSGSTRHDRSSDDSPQSHPSLTSLSAQPRSRSPCPPSTLPQNKHQAILRPSFPPSEQPRVPCPANSFPQTLLSLPCASRLIPHSPLHSRCSPPAISCLGASQTPAVGARPSRSHAGVREPSQKQTKSLQRQEPSNAR